MARDKKGSVPTGRRATVRVKTARGRTVSSQRWLQRQLNDPYVEEAKKRGYRSRAAFKLLQIDDQFKILKPGGRIVDLGAAPGGWTQVAVERVSSGRNKGVVIGIDITPVEPIAGATVLAKDFYDADAAIGVVDDQQLLDAILVEKPLRLLLGRALADRDQPLLRHQRADGCAAFGGEANVAVGEDTRQPAAAALDHGNARDLVGFHQRQGVGQRLVRVNGDGIHHHAALELLHPADLVGLLLGLEVLVDDADAAGLRHGDRHARLGDRVHRRRHQRDVELDGAREACAGVGLSRQDRRRGRFQEDVIEGERFLNLHTNLRRGETKTAALGEGRRVGEPLYTPPRTSQAC